MRATRPAPEGEARRYRERGYWRDVCADEYLAWCAREFGDRVAVVDRGRRATYKEIDEQASRFAAGLVGLGVRPGDVVAFQLPNWLEAVIAYQGIMKVGAIANPIVPIYRGKELRFILRQGSAKVAVIPAQYRDFDYVNLYEGLRPELPNLETVIVLGDAPRSMTSWESFMATAAVEDKASIQAINDRTRNADDVALLLYTSGTTAEPKGALHSHNTLIYDVHSMGEWFSLNERDVIFNPSPATHITGVLCALNMPFVLGAKVVLQDIWDESTAIELVSTEKATFMIFATPFLRGMTHSAELRKHDVSSIRYIVCGGADIPIDLMRLATERLGTVVRQYGATEAPSTTCTNLRDPVRRRLETDGRWMLPTVGYVSDKNGEPVPPGTTGEVVWKGPDMFLGYLDPELNNEAFTASGFFRTGDIGVMDNDGYLNIRGRQKDIINRGGEKISAREIEDMIAGHPDVVEVAVVAMPDPVLGEKSCAYIVLDDQAEISADDILRHLESQDIAKQKLPERIEFVNSLPKTASGKIQKFILREQIWRTASHQNP